MGRPVVVNDGSESISLAGPYSLTALEPNASLNPDTRKMSRLFDDRLNVALLGLALLGLGTGLVLWLSGQPDFAGIASSKASPKAVPGAR